MGEDTDASEPTTGADAGRDGRDSLPEGGADSSSPADGRGVSEATDAGDGETPPADWRGVTLDGTDDDDPDDFWDTYGGKGRTVPNPERSFTRSDPGTAALENLSYADLRDHYGPLRSLLKQREASYTSFQRKLSQARIPQTYDQYLATVIARALLIAALGVVIGVVAGAGLLGAARYGLAPGVVSGLGLPVGTAAGAVAASVATLGVLGGALYWVWRRIVRVRSRIASRRREINYNLPYAVTFMYALARADVSFDRIVLRLADAADTYGAVAYEFDRVVRDVEMFGNNLYIGLENLRTVTPSEELRRFVDDALTVLESGGDLAAFLRDEVDTQLETAVAEQEAYIERLELLSEVFVVGFVAAPLFVLVVLIVVSFLGAGTLPVIAALVYAAIPLSLAGFVVLIDAVGESFRNPTASLSAGPERSTPPPADGDSPDWLAAYERDKRLTGLRNRIRDQALRTREEPWRAFLFSVPLALSLPAAAVAMGALPLGLPALLANPVELTTGLAVAPLVIATVPVAVVYEYRDRKERALQRRFPDLLELLATSNRRGLSLTRGLEIVTNSTSGRLGEELRTLRNDIVWNADLPAAFEAFGERLSSPALARTADLIAEGSRATGDLHIVLEVAATDTAERVRLERERRQTLQSYLVIVVVGFLVYLLVVLLLAANFLTPIEAFSADAVTAESGPISVGAVPVAEIRTVLFHSALIQGFGSGVVAGKLAEDSLYSGLKYGIALVILAVIAFVVV